MTGAETGVAVRNEVGATDFDQRFAVERDPGKFARLPLRRRLAPEVVAVADFAAQEDPRALPASSTRSRLPAPRDGHPAG